MKSTNKFVLGLELFIKRIVDIIGAVVGIILLIPITVLVKLVYICTGDFHSIFLCQKRIGKNGKEFCFFKFRTMIPNADERLKELLKENKELEKENKENKKLRNDPRITRMGKFLRNFSIDEMPQFINVLFGKMSIIGNRPYLPREKEDMGKYFDDIVRLKPGITGLWQVSGRSNVTFNYRLKIEKEYTEKFSLWLDVKIFFKTFIVLFSGI